MKKPIIRKKPAVTAALVLIAVSARAATITYEGTEYWINGVNVPWHSFGVDAGEHPWWGHLYDPAWFEDLFADCEAHGVNCVRLWVHCDGRASPEFDAGGYVTDLDATFLADLADICARADAHGVMVMPCLWSFDMTENRTLEAGPHAGLHADLIRDAAKTQSYIDNALVPMVQYLADAPNLFAWEIINEPEWSVSGAGFTYELVDRPQMQRFCAMIAEAIHEHSGKMVTVGSAGLKWNSDVLPAEGNWWSDSRLQAAHGSSLAFLDFYQIHYYDWMFNLGYDPFDPDLPVSVWSLDKPVLVGECPASDDGCYTMRQQLVNSYNSGYVGVMFWSYGADYGANWESLADELLTFHDEYPDIPGYLGPGRPPAGDWPWFSCAPARSSDTVSPDGLRRAWFGRLRRAHHRQSSRAVAASLAVFALALAALHAAQAPALRAGQPRSPARMT